MILAFLADILVLYRLDHESKARVKRLIALLDTVNCVSLARTRNEALRCAFLPLIKQFPQQLGLKAFDVCLYVALIAVFFTLQVE